MARATTALRSARGAADLYPLRTALETAEVKARLDGARADHNAKVAARLRSALSTLAEDVTRAYEWERACEARFYQRVTSNDERSPVRLPNAPLAREFYRFRDLWVE